MDTYRKRHIEEDILVQAVQLTPANATEIADLVEGDIIREVNAENPQEYVPGINFRGRHGMERLSVGDYLVQEQDYFDKFADFLFKARYEKFEEPTDEAPSRFPEESAGRHIFEGSDKPDERFSSHPSTGLQDSDLNSIQSD